MSQASNQISTTYNEQYLNESSEWRDLGGKQKSSNIIDLCAKHSSKKTLDIGSGDGAVLYWLDKRNFTNNLSSLEISDSGIAAITARNLGSLKEVKKFDGYKIPYEDKSFELATCSHVIEHVEHPRLLLREIARVSEYQYFEVPIDFSFFVDEKIKHYLDYGHINIYTPALFKFLLKSEGFEILDERFLFTSDELIEFQFKNNLKRKYMQKLKNFIVSLSPYKKIKPNAYSVLCKQNGNKLSIF
jgi:ubiquinone/menaquinone biosynthesis C-methylase UbiE